MIDIIKKLFVFGWESRTERAISTLDGMLAQGPVQAMQAVANWLQSEITRAESKREGLLLIRALDSRLRGLVETAQAGLIEAHTNHTRTVLLLQAAVPFCSTVALAYTNSLRREMVELARKTGNASLVQASVANWLYWIGRDFVIRYARESNDQLLPWHEIKPAAEFALGLGGGIAAKLSRPDGEAGRLQRQLAHLVLLSRSVTPDFQGRQLLIADRLADVLASFIQVSNEHSAATPFGQAAQDDSPPTVLSVMAVDPKTESKGLFYGLEKSLQELAALEYLITSQHKVPQKVDPDGKLQVAETLLVIRHLKNRWAGRSIKRQSERKPITGQLNIAYEYNAIRRLVIQATQPTTARTIESTVERAAVEDVSASGVGLKLVKHTGWLKLGLLMGVRTDKDPNWRIGVVRRAVSSGHGEMVAGLQLIGRDPESVRLTRRAKVSQWEKVSEVQSYENMLALYLRPEGLNENQHLLILAKPELEVGKIYGAPATREGDLTFRILGLNEIATDCVIYRAEKLAEIAKAEPPAAAGPSL